MPSVLLYVVLQSGVCVSTLGPCALTQPTYDGVMPGTLAPYATVVLEAVTTTFFL
jgi:hypothetical protein